MWSIVMSRKCGYTPRCPHYHQNISEKAVCSLWYHRLKYVPWVKPKHLREYANQNPEIMFFKFHGNRIVEVYESFQKENIRFVEKPRTAVTSPVKSAVVQPLLNYCKNTGYTYVINQNITSAVFVSLSKKHDPGGHVRRK